MIQRLVCGCFMGCADNDTKARTRQRLCSSGTAVAGGAVAVNTLLPPYSVEEWDAYLRIQQHLDHPDEAKRSFAAPGRLNSRVLPAAGTLCFSRIFLEVLVHR